MFKPDDPRELATDLLNRSICRVKVAAVIADKAGISGWGWNSAGAGWGLHAEAHAIGRTNPVRLHSGATIYVASTRKRNGKIVSSKPCADCAYLIGKHGLKVEYRDANGEWIKL